MIAFLTALESEIAPLRTEADVTLTDTRGRRDYHVGTLWGQDAAMVVSRPCKVSAASAATTLIESYRAEEIFVLGFAGALAPVLNRGDAVVANGLWQHDVIPSSRFARCELPFLGQRRFRTDEHRRKKLIAAGAKAGDIATGDQFISHEDAKAEVRGAVPDAIAVDMESAAVAQVCFEHDVPVTVLRTISDSAGAEALTKFVAAEQDKAMHAQTVALLRAALA